MTRSVNHVERFREAVAEGRPVVGTEITLTDPLASEAAAEAGSDFLWIETEHSHLDLPSVLAHLLAARAAQVPALVRVGWNDPSSSSASSTWRRPASSCPWSAPPKRPRPRCAPSATRPRGCAAGGQSAT